MARIDDYMESLRLAAVALQGADLHRQAKLAGAGIDLEKDGRLLIHLPLLGTPLLVRVGDGVQVVQEGDAAEVSLPEQILACHYLLRASGEPASGELITFRQIPDGHFYFDAFQRRARDPFLATFGSNPELFRRCAELLGGQSVDTGDVGMEFQVLPHIAVQLVLWQGDDEFPPDASVLFDAGIRDRLPVEDIAVMSGMLVYRLMGLARSEINRVQNP